jgi:predicted O-methyltransferase YrrM
MRPPYPATLVRPLLLFYRKLRHSRGDGVHSPFVYGLITQVIRERAAYYRFEDIEALRRDLLRDETSVTYPDPRYGGRLRRTTLSRLVRREAISPRNGALLFRLTNRFHSERILQVGTSLGFSTLYLSSHRPEVRCFVLEPVGEFAVLARQVCERAGLPPAEVRVGRYAGQLHDVLRAMGTIDFLYINGRNEQGEELQQVFVACLPFFAEEAVIVCEGIRRRMSMHGFWKELCAHPRVTVTMDLFSLGIAFVAPRLHKKNYVVYY